MSFWTEERAEALRALWAAGSSAAECMRALGAPSRNAVVGKIHRMGLSNSRPAAQNPRLVVKKPKPVKAKRVVVRAPAPPPKTFKPQPVSTPIVSQPVSLVDREKFQCSVILDGYDEPTCCGAAAVRQGMCAGHAEMMLAGQGRPLNVGYYAGLGNVITLTPGRRLSQGRVIGDSVYALTGIAV